MIFSAAVFRGLRVLIGGNEIVKKGSLLRRGRAGKGGGGLT